MTISERPSNSPAALEIPASSRSSFRRGEGSFELGQSLWQILPAKPTRKCRA